MTDKVQKIREEVERMQKRAEHNFNISLAEIERQFWLGESNVLTLIGTYIDSMQEEPVSEELEEAAKEWLRPQLDKSYANYGEVKMMELTHFDGYVMLDAIEFGSQWQKEHLWKPTDGDNLPEIDKDVIALEALDGENYYRVVFAHRVDSDRVIRTTIDNKPLELHPSKYGKAGWNLPNLKYWLDLELPKTK